jgi:hypothetical protein
MSEQTLQTIADLVGAGPTAQPTPRLKAPGIDDAAHAALVAERKAIAEKGGRPPAVQPVRDILLQSAYSRVLEAQPKLLDRLIEGATNKNDPLHERCLDIMAKRALPIAFFESLAKSEFRTEDEGGAKPRFVINISTGAMPVAKVDVIDATDVEFKELP